MIKNILIILLFISFTLSVVWHRTVISKIDNKPAAHVILPDGYCGEFVVFWGENTPPVDEPPEFLSYNYYPEAPYNAVIINLPEPYERAGLRFIYQGQEGPVGRNPLFRMTGVTGVQLNGGIEVRSDGYTYSLPGIDIGVDVNIFTITQSDPCDNEFDTDLIDISDIYLTLLEDEE